MNEDKEITEDTEKKSLPYPIMDIDFVRTEEHGKGGSYYYSTIYTKYHYTVQYNCCFCGVQNEDEEQVFEQKKRTCARDEMGRLENEEQVVRDKKDRGGRNTAAELEKKIAAREYGSLGLKCRCRWCGKKQPWSDFWPAEGTIKAYRWLCKKGGLYHFLAILAVPLLAFFILFCPYRYVKPAVLALLAAPSLAALAHNYLTQKKSLRLNERYIPEIHIVYKTEE